MGKRGRGTNSSAAVMAQRAPEVVEADDDELAMFRLLDFFPTPPWAGRAGAELIRELDPEARVVREPACGRMHMAGPLQEYFPEVLPSDVYPHTPNTPVRDWLDPDQWGEPDCDWVITNPPFLVADQFVTLGLQRARRGVALLLRLGFVETDGRYALFEGGNHPLTMLAPFSERVSMVLGKWDPEAKLATAYAWFVWMKGADPRPPRWIPPGTRRRLWLKDDAMRYGGRTPLPLFPEAA